MQMLIYLTLFRQLKFQEFLRQYVSDELYIVLDDIVGVVQYIVVQLRIQM